MSLSPTPTRRLLLGEHRRISHSLSPRTTRSAMSMQSLEEEGKLESGHFHFSSVASNDISSAASSFIREQAGSDYTSEADSFLFNSSSDEEGDAGDPSDTSSARYRRPSSCGSSRRHRRIHSRDDSLLGGQSTEDESRDEVSLDLEYVEESTLEGSNDAVSIDQEERPPDEISAPSPGSVGNRPSAVVDVRQAVQHRSLAPSASFRGASPEAVLSPSKSNYPSTVTQHMIPAVPDLSLETKFSYSSSGHHRISSSHRASGRVRDDDMSSSSSGEEVEVEEQRTGYVFKGGTSDVLHSPNDRVRYEKRTLRSVRGAQQSTGERGRSTTRVEYVGQSTEDESRSGRVPSERSSGSYSTYSSDVYDTESHSGSYYSSYDEDEEVDEPDGYYSPSESHHSIDESVRQMYRTIVEEQQQSQHDEEETDEETDEDGERETVTEMQEPSALLHNEADSSRPLYRRGVSAMSGTSEATGASDAPLLSANKASSFVRRSGRVSPPARVLEPSGKSFDSLDLRQQYGRLESTTSAFTMNSMDFRSSLVSQSGVSVEAGSAPPQFDPGKLQESRKRDGYRSENPHFESEIKGEHRKERSPSKAPPAAAFHHSSLSIGLSTSSKSESSRSESDSDESSKKSFKSTNEADLQPTNGRSASIGIPPSVPKRGSTSNNNLVLTRPFYEPTQRKKTPESGDGDNLDSSFYDRLDSLRQKSLNNSLNSSQQASSLGGELPSVRQSQKHFTVAESGGYDAVSMASALMLEGNDETSGRSQFALLDPPEEEVVSHKEVATGIEASQSPPLSGSTSSTTSRSGEDSENCVSPSQSPKQLAENPVSDITNVASELATEETGATRSCVDNSISAMLDPLGEEVAARTEGSRAHLSGSSSPTTSTRGEEDGENHRSPPHSQEHFTVAVTGGSDAFIVASEVDLENDGETRSGTDGNRFELLDPPEKEVVTHIRASVTSPLSHSPSPASSRSSSEQESGKGISEAHDENTKAVTATKLLKHLEKNEVASELPASTTESGSSLVSDPRAYGGETFSMVSEITGDEKVNEGSVYDRLEYLKQKSLSSAVTDKKLGSSERSMDGEDDPLVLDPYDSLALTTELVRGAMDTSEQPQISKIRDGEGSAKINNPIDSRIPKTTFEDRRRDEDENERIVDDRFQPFQSVISKEGSSDGEVPGASDDVESSTDEDGVRYGMEHKLDASGKSKRPADSAASLLIAPESSGQGQALPLVGLETSWHPDFPDQEPRLWSLDEGADSEAQQRHTRLSQPMHENGEVDAGAVHRSKQSYHEVDEEKAHPLDGARSNNEADFFFEHADNQEEQIPKSQGDLLFGVDEESLNSFKLYGCEAAAPNEDEEENAPQTQGDLLHGLEEGSLASFEAGDSYGKVLDTEGQETGTVSARGELSGRAEEASSRDNYAMLGASDADKVHDPARGQMSDEERVASFDSTNNEKANNGGECLNGVEEDKGMGSACEVEAIAAGDARQEVVPKTQGELLHGIDEESIDSFKFGTKEDFTTNDVGNVGGAEGSPQDQDVPKSQGDLLFGVEEESLDSFGPGEKGKGAEEGEAQGTLKIDRTEDDKLSINIDLTHGVKEQSSASLRSQELKSKQLEADTWVSRPGQKAPAEGFVEASVLPTMESALKSQVIAADPGNSVRSTVPQQEDERTRKALDSGKDPPALLFSLPLGGELAANEKTRDLATSVSPEALRGKGVEGGLLIAASEVHNLQNEVGAAVEGGGVGTVRHGDDTSEDDAFERAREFREVEEWEGHDGASSNATDVSSRSGTDFAATENEVKVSSGASTDVESFRLDESGVFEGDSELAEVEEWEGHGLNSVQTTDSQEDSISVSLGKADECRNTEMSMARLGLRQDEDMQDRKEGREPLQNCGSEPENLLHPRAEVLFFSANHGGSFAYCGSCTNALLSALDKNSTDFHSILFEMRKRISVDADRNGRVRVASSFNIADSDSFRFQGKRRRALLIGCEYSGTTLHLRNAHNSVVAMAEFLEDNCGFEDSALLVDDGSNVPPTRRNILKIMRAMCKGTTTKDEIFVHFCGRTCTPAMSAKTAKSVMLPSDYATAGVITAEDLDSVLFGSRARVVCFWDTLLPGIHLILRHELVMSKLDATDTVSVHHRTWEEHAPTKTVSTSGSVSGTLDEEKLKHEAAPETLMMPPTSRNGGLPENVSKGKPSESERIFGSSAQTPSTEAHVDKQLLKEKDENGTVVAVLTDSPIETEGNTSCTGALLDSIEKSKQTTLAWRDIPSMVQTVVSDLRQNQKVCVVSCAPLDYSAEFELGACGAGGRTRALLANSRDRQQSNPVDIERMHQHLIRHEGVAPVDVIKLSLKDSEKHLKGLRNAIGKLVEQTKPGDAAVFCYSGPQLPAHVCNLLKNVCKGAKLTCVLDSASDDLGFPYRYGPGEKTISKPNPTTSQPKPLNGGGAMVTQSPASVAPHHGRLFHSPPTRQPSVTTRVGIGSFMTRMKFGWDSLGEEIAGSAVTPRTRRKLVRPRKHPHIQAV